jgi:nucleoside-diphosphate kinase
LASKTEVKLEKTFTIIKPDAVEKKYSGEILTAIENAGFKVLGMKFLKLSESHAKAFYDIHKERPFFNDLIAFMTRNPVYVMALEKDNAVSDFRKLIGATDPAKAEAGTIRKRFASNVGENAIHGSDSPENALREIGFFFAETELI